MSRPGHRSDPSSPPAGEKRPGAGDAGVSGQARRARAIALRPDAGGDGTLTLSFERRFRRRGLLTTDAGEDVILDLAEATELRAGSGLLLDDGRTLSVRAAAEALAEVVAPDLARIAWHVGNRHTPCEVQPHRLLIQRDHVIEDMVRRLGATVRHVEAPFQPEGGAYGHGRTHGHAPTHAPGTPAGAARHDHG